MLFALLVAVLSLRYSVICYTSIKVVNDKHNTSWLVVSAARLNDMFTPLVKSSVKVYALDSWDSTVFNVFIFGVTIRKRGRQDKWWEAQLLMTRVSVDSWPGETHHSTLNCQRLVLELWADSTLDSHSTHLISVRLYCTAHSIHMPNARRGAKRYRRDAFEVLNSDRTRWQIVTLLYIAVLLWIIL